MRLISVTKVAQVFMTGHVGLGKEHHWIWVGFQQSTKQAYHFVSLWQVDAGALCLLPKIRNGIQSDAAHAMLEKLTQDPHHFQEDSWFLKIKIELIVTKSTPEMACAIAGFDGA